MSSLVRKYGRMERISRSSARIETTLKITIRLLVALIKPAQSQNHRIVVYADLNGHVLESEVLGTLAQVQALHIATKFLARWSGGGKGSKR